MIFRYEVNPSEEVKNGKNIRSQKLSKSSDWTEVPLEVPDDNLVLNKQLTVNQDAPKPPPRKHKKGLREKIESVAKNGLQALSINNNKKPVDEPLFVKKTIDYSCPHDDHDHAHHNAHHKHQSKNEMKLPKGTPKLSEKIAKRRKNLSLISLPNYSELKFSIANSDNTDNKADKQPIKRNSLTSLPDECKKLSTPLKKDYMARCRSFGSILPNQLLEKLKNSKATTDVESDDSFGPLEDWDLKIIEHYNPKDASLPRARKLPKTDTEILSNIESLIVQDEEVAPPVPPVRRSESLVKKLNRVSTESPNVIVKNLNNAPPSTPNEQQEQLPIIRAAQLPTEDEEGKVEHSSLMKILEEFSIKDKQKAQNELNDINHTKNDINLSTSPVSNNFIIESSKKTLSHPVEDFLNAERTS